MALDLREWSPRSDSNRRPSDYESDRSLSTGPIQDHRGCSGAGPISFRAVLWGLVVAPGLPERLPPACVGAGEPASGSGTSSIGSQSEVRRKAASIRRRPARGLLVRAPRCRYSGRPPTRSRRLALAVVLTTSFERRKLRIRRHAPPWGPCRPAILFTSRLLGGAATCDPCPSTAGRQRIKVGPETANGGGS